MYVIEDIIIGYTIDIFGHFDRIGNNRRLFSLVSGKTCLNGKGDSNSLIQPLSGIRHVEEVL